MTLIPERMMDIAQVMLHARLIPVLALTAAPVNVLADEAASGYRGSEVISLGGLLQMATGLVLVLVLIFGVAWFAKRFGRFHGAVNDRLRLMGGIHLGNRERIVIIQAEDVRLVVGVSPGCIRTLHVLGADDREGDERAAGKVPAGDSFLSRFNHEIRKRIQS